MAKYVLTSDLMTGDPLIDKEHKCLMDAANHLVEACSTGQGKAEVHAVAAFLINYVKTHFNHEEQLMAEHNYPKFLDHRTFHEKYTEMMTKLAEEYEGIEITSAELFEINKQLKVLINHIRTSDKALAQYIAQH